MTSIVLPKLNQAGANEWADVEDNDVAVRDVVNGKLDNGNLSGAAGITRANLAAEAKPLRWYTPKVIATEESRTNIAYGTLTTADEIKEVVLPENSLLLVWYEAIWKESVAGAARAALFLGANQLKYTDNTVQEARSYKFTSFTDTTSSEKEASAGTFYPLATHGAGLASSFQANPAPPGTGYIVGPSKPLITNAGSSSEPHAVGGLLTVTGVTATLNISVQFKASSGSVTAKTRKLWVAVLE